MQEHYAKTDILARLSLHASELTKSQRLVADYMTNNMMEAAFSTVEKTAHTVGVSTTTVVRLALTLGYSGYAELQGSLKKYLTTMSAPIHMFSTVSQSEEGESREDYVQMMELEVRNLQTTCAMLSSDLVDQACRTLCKARNIYVIGARSCEGSARFLAYNLDRMFLNTRFVESNPNSAPEIINRIGMQDALVTIGFSRYVRTVFDVTRMAKEAGAVVIGITDHPSCPWRPFVDHLFLCDNQSANFHHSPLSVMYLTNVLLRRCSRLSVARVEKNLNKLENAVQGMQIFMKK